MTAWLKWRLGLGPQEAVEQLLEQARRGMPDAVRLVGKEPPRTMEDRWAIGGFFRMSNRDRQIGMNGDGPIPSAAIDRWLDSEMVSSREIRAELFGHFEALDALYLKSRSN